MNDERPVTKTDLDAAFADFESKLESKLDVKLDARFAAQEDKLMNAMRQIETNPLTEFHRYARPERAPAHR